MAYRCAVQDPACDRFEREEDEVIGSYGGLQ